ncbi:hypothetical protein ABT324_19215 [Saccharopolyspora sp. NPDC000359]
MTETELAEAIAARREELARETDAERAYRAPWSWSSCRCSAAS